VFIPYCIFAPSLDRIDNERGYAKDNVVMCMRFVNNGRNAGSITDVQELFKEKPLGILSMSRCYLVGPIESAKDYGVGWR
jgi:hypothetical protein